VHLDLEVILLNAGQLRHHSDAVLDGEDVHGWEAGGCHGTGEALHLILEPAQLAERVGAPEQAEGVQGGHCLFLPIEIGDHALWAGAGSLARDIR
jgi:hypothetical protein